MHIPSISVESKCRQDMINFTARENLQMIRLCAISDPLVDVVYVSPFNVSDEVKGYYIRMLELGKTFITSGYTWFLYTNCF